MVSACTWTNVRYNCTGPNILFHASPFILNDLEVKVMDLEASLDGSVECASDWRPGGHGFNPHRVLQQSFVEIDHEIFSMVILSIPLIQEGQLSVSGERM